MSSVFPYTEETLYNTTKIVKYPNPFFDLSNNYIPKNIKTLFKYCRDFFHVNSFLRNVITKLTEYPITDILFPSNISEELREKWRLILHDHLKIKSFLIEIGLDYFTYGNSFISVILKFKRFLKCTKCGQEYLMDKIKFDFRNFEFYAMCSCSSSKVKMEIKDEYIKSIQNFRLIRWAPENIDIDYNPISGNSTYYYTIPAKIKTLIMQGNPTILKEIPEIFLKALKTSKKIVLDNNNLYHFKYPTLAEEDMGWGKPIVLPALKEIYYLQTLRKGNEAIAAEHIVPKKTISPANTATMDPYSQMNLGKWRTEVENSIKKWKVDSNHIAVFPIPMQYQELGGNAKMLMVTPEMRFIEETIITNLGVPLEFIKGGTSWTGSSVSLRIVENRFLNYREQLLDFLNFFLVPQISKYLNIEKVKLAFKKFKMADDSESKQLAINLNAANKISDEKLLDEFGYDYKTEKEAIKRNILENMQFQIEQSEKDAEARGKAMVIQAKYQARAQVVMENETFKAKLELFYNEISKELGTVPEDILSVINQYAFQFMSLPPDIQQIKLMEMQNKMPITFNFVNERLQFLQNSQMMQPQFQPQEQPENNPNNEKPIGTRKQDQIPITKSDVEKQHGPTNTTEP